MVKIFRKPILFHHFTLFLPFYYFLTLNKGKLFLALWTIVNIQEIV